MPRSAIAGLAAAGLTLVGACNVAPPEARLREPYGPAAANHALTRSECIALAMNSAPTAAAWTARLRRAHAVLAQASRLPNPSLAAAWEDFGLNSAAESATLQTTLTLGFALQDAFARGSRQAAAEHELRAEVASLTEERNRLAATVSQAYDELLAARDRVRLLDLLTEVARANNETLTRFVSAGLAARIQADQAEAELLSAQADDGKAHAAARALELELAFALGFDRPVGLDLAESGTGKRYPPRADVDTLVQDAMHSRGEVVAAVERYAAQRGRLQLAVDRVQFIPTISLGPRLVGGELLGVAGVDAVLPVFDNGSSEVEMQDADLLAAAAEVRRVANNVAREVCLAVEAVRSTEDYLENSARRVAGLRLQLRQAAERLFVAGEVEFPEVLRARREDTAAQLDVLDAQRAVAAAQTDLERALGLSYTQDHAENLSG